MININFKPCCQDCALIDVDVETATLVQSGEKHVKIHCAHDVVCDRFNENEIEKDCNNCFYEDVSSDSLPCKNCSKCYVVSEDMKSKWKAKEVENDKL